MADSRIMSLGWPRGVIRFKINIPFKSEVSDTSDDEAPDGVKVIHLVNLQLANGWMNTFLKMIHAILLVIGGAGDAGDGGHLGLVGVP